MKPAFIFDMDGVLIDSEPIYKKINTAIFGRLGALQCIEEYDKYIGISVVDMWRDVKSKSKTEKTIEELHLEGLEAKYEYISSNGIEAISGIPELVRVLKNAGFTLAVASGSPLRNIQLVLEKLKLADKFDHLAGCESVSKGKPAPDIFLHVAHKLNVKAELCTVLEDSHHGVAAAKSAGMFCIGFVNPSSGKQNLSAADITISNLTDVDRLRLPQFKAR